MDGLGEQEFRAKCIELIHVFLRDLKSLVIKQAMDHFTGVIKSVVKALFPKHTVRYYEFCSSVYTFFSIYVFV